MVVVAKKEDNFHTLIPWQKTNKSSGMMVCKVLRLVPTQFPNAFRKVEGGGVAKPSQSVGNNARSIDRWLVVALVKYNDIIITISLLLFFYITLDKRYLIHFYDFFLAFFNIPQLDNNNR